MSPASPINAIGPANLLRLKAGPIRHIENAAISKVKPQQCLIHPEDHGCSRRGRFFELTTYNLALNEGHCP